MKSRPLVVALLATLAGLPFGGEARADSKQECTAAADAGQSARDQGRYRAAHEAFATCAREVCPRIVAQMCGGWLRDLDGATPTLVLGAKDPNGGDLADVHVTLDGAPFTDRLDGKPLPIDPGAHNVRFTHDGYEPSEQRVVARSGEKNRLVMVAFKSLPSSELAGPVLNEPTSSAESPSSTSGVRVATSVVLFALAAASGGTGAFFLVQSNHRASSAAALRAGIPSDACTNGGSATCTDLSNDVDARRRDGLAAGLLFGGAGALAIAGVATLLLWPRHESPPVARIVPSFVVGGGALNIAGSF